MAVDSLDVGKSYQKATLSTGSCNNIITIGMYPTLLQLMIYSPHKTIIAVCLGKKCFFIQLHTVSVNHNKYTFHWIIHNKYHKNKKQKQQQTNTAELLTWIQCQ